MTVEFATLDSLARRAARRYKRRWSSLDERDLHQEAWIALLLAQRSYDPERGPFEHYGSVAARRWLFGYLLRRTAPVSAAWGKLRALAPCTAVALTEEVEPTSHETRHALEVQQLRARIREAIADALAPLGADAPLAFSLLSGDLRPRDIRDRDTRDIYKLVRSARRLLTGSLKLWAVHKEENTP